MTALKIAYLCDISPEHVHPYSGGNARIYRALSERAEVTVLPQDWGMAEPVRRAIYATSDGAQLRLRWRAHLALAPIIAGPINRALRDGGFDVLFGAYSFQSLSHVAPPSGCIKVYSSDATPSVYKNSQIGQEYGSSMLARHLLDPLTLRAERRVLNALDLMLCPSDWLKREAEALYGLPPGLAQVLPWGANIDDPGPAPPPPAPGTDARLDLLIIARDWFAKGGPDAFQTMTELRGRGLDARLTVIGCTPPRAHINAHVTQLGPLDKSKPEEAARFATALRRAHFLMQPSFESYGFAYCEAAAYGLPSLCHDVGGVPVRDGITGHPLPASATPGDFADVVMRYIADPAAYLALRASARAEFETRLNWPAWADAAIALMQEKKAQTP